MKTKETTLPTRREVSERLMRIVTDAALSQSTVVVDALKRRGYHLVQVAGVGDLYDADVRLLEPIRSDGSSITMLSINIDCAIRVSSWRRPRRRQRNVWREVRATESSDCVEIGPIRASIGSDWLERFPHRDAACCVLSDGSDSVRDLTDAMQLSFSDVLRKSLVESIVCFETDRYVLDVFEDSGFPGRFGMAIQRGGAEGTELWCTVSAVCSIGLARGSREQWQGEYF